jgi:hypothetical protein
MSIKINSAAPKIGKSMPQLPASTTIGHQTTSLRAPRLTRLATRNYAKGEPPSAAPTQPPPGGFGAGAGFGDTGLTGGS